MTPSRPTIQWCLYLAQPEHPRHQRAYFPLPPEFLQTYLRRHAHATPAATFAPAGKARSCLTTASEPHPPSPPLPPLNLPPPPTGTTIFFVTSFCRAGYLRPLILATLDVGLHKN